VLWNCTYRIHDDPEQPCLHEKRQQPHQQVYHVATDQQAPCYLVRASACRGCQGLQPAAFRALVRCPNLSCVGILVQDSQSRAKSSVQGENAPVGQGGCRCRPATLDRLVLYEGSCDGVTLILASLGTQIAPDNTARQTAWIRE